MKKTKILPLVECAIMVALSYVLSMIKVYEMPFGGAVTLLSMLPVCVAALRHGYIYGLGTAFVYSVTQAFMSGAAGWGLTPATLIICYLSDYIIAFTVLGICGFAKDKDIKTKLIYIIIACFLRFASHYISGVTIWSSSALDNGFSNPYLYSLLYNGAYMLPETIFTCIGAFFIFKALSRRKMI